MSAVPIHFKQARLDVIVVHGGGAGIPDAEAWLHASLSGWSEEKVKKSPYLDFRFQGFSCFHPEGFPSPIRALGIAVNAFMPAQMLSPTADAAAQNLLFQAVDHEATRTVAPPPVRGGCLLEPGQVTSGP
jgi:hypothetical protein